MFSTKGKRPLPNQMSTGDLDGDVYMIIWDERIVSNVRKDIPEASHDKEN